MFLNPDINDTHRETWQSDRLPQGLRDGYVKLDERTLDDLIGQCAEFSRFLKYYDATDGEAGDWHDFFTSIYHFPEGNEERGHVKFSTKEELDAIIADKPHLSLLVTFLHLFGIEQEHLNTLTEKHLEYYYKTLLGFNHKAGKPGTVTVLAQLAKNTQKAIIPAGTRFDAGKDSDGHTVFYKTTTDSAIVAGKVSHRYCQDNAEFGVLICSSALSGLQGETSVRFGVLPKGCKIYFTSSSGWEKATTTSTGIGATMTIGAGLLAPFSSKVHGMDATIDCPAFKIVFPSIQHIQLASAIFRSFSVKSVPSKNGNAAQIDYSSVLSGIKASVDSLSSNADANASKQLAKYISDLSAAIGKVATTSSANGETIVVKDATLLYFSSTGVFDTPDIIVDEANVFTPPSLSLELTSLSAGDTASICFRMDQTKCDITKTIPEEGVQWFYLTDKKWKSLPPSAILSDTTSEMTQSGIVTFRIPSDATTDKGVIHLRLTIPDMDVYPVLEEVQLNAVELVYDTSSEGKALHGTPLAAQTITKPEYAIAGIKSFSQPYPGESGEDDESRDGYLCRVSERLRHKDRAVDAWDYERIILERHPSIAAVKCIPCTDKDGQFSAGKITIVLVPDTDKIPQQDSLRPQVDLTTVKSVESLIREKCSPFVGFSIVNPKYQAIQVKCTLKLQDTCADTSHAVEQIREKLTEFLAPWNDKGHRQGFDHIINTSKITYFIETLDEYVDHIISIQIYLDGMEQDGDIIPADEATVLTSVAASEHIITVTEER